MVAAIFWTLLVVLLIGAMFAARKLFESRGFVIGDLTLFTLPFVAWVVLVITGMRPKSLSNLIEPILLVLIVLAAFIVRSFAFRRHANRVRSNWAVGVCVAAAVVLYAFVQVLEE